MRSKYYVCYADNPETIDALKDNIREAIGEIQLHTIDNVLKNCTDRVNRSPKKIFYNKINLKIFL